MSDLPPPSSSPDLPPPATLEVAPAPPVPQPPVVLPAAADPAPSEPPADGGDPLVANPEDKTLGLVMYLLPLLGLASFRHFTGIALIAIAPLVLWQYKKGQSRYLDEAGKEVVNFNICVVACFIALTLLWEIGIHLYLGWLFSILSWLLRLAWLVSTIISAVNANGGKIYRFPFTYRLIK